MGDFYELFFDDARGRQPRARHRADQARQASGRRTSRCAACRSMRADDYLQRLIALGHRVAVCEQIEDPAEAKKRGAKSVVRRDVVRLVTPGTHHRGEAARRPAEANYLMALARIRGGGATRAMALAWIDISTGEFRVAETERRAAAGRYRCASTRASDRAPTRCSTIPSCAACSTCSAASPVRSRPRCSISATAERPHRTLFRRRDARRLRHLLARRAGGGCGAPSPMSRRRRSAERPPLGRPRARKRRLDAVHRRGDPRQSRTDAHALGRARRQRCSRRSTARSPAAARGCSPSG